jgi:hypothetical protein
MVQVIRQPDKFQGLAAALQGIIQGQAARHQKQKQAGEIASINQFLQSGGQQPQPQTPFGQNLLTQGLAQQRQFGQQQDLQRQNQQAALTQAIAIQKAKNVGAVKTPLEVRQEEADLTKTLAETKKLGETKPGTLKDRLGLKVSEGTATKQEEDVFDQLSKTASTNISVGEGKVTTNSLALNKTFKADERIKDIRTIEKFTQNMVTALDRSTRPGFKNFGPTDITLAKSFQKLTDLGSTVREGEFATTFEGQSLINKVRGKLQSVISGGLGFTPEDRKELVDLALALQEDSRKLYNKAIIETSATSDELGLNTRAVLGGVKPFEFADPEDAGAQQGVGIPPLNQVRGAGTQIQQKINSMTPEQRTLRIQELRSRRPQ